mmetsp:Transcript_2240/g.5582  ORF Transcript_2240/g.5582 Transcript_2240/m.5582 type:complete len:275 (+) Transcript_2240:1168-1992(+)
MEGARQPAGQIDGRCGQGDQADGHGRHRRVRGGRRGGASGREPGARRHQGGARLQDAGRREGGRGGRRGRRRGAGRAGHGGGRRDAARRRGARDGEPLPEAAQEGCLGADRRGGAVLQGDLRRPGGDREGEQRADGGDPGLRAAAGWLPPAQRRAVRLGGADGGGREPAGVLRGDDCRARGRRARGRADQGVRRRRGGGREGQGVAGLSRPHKPPSRGGRRRGVRHPGWRQAQPHARARLFLERKRGGRRERWPVLESCRWLLQTGEGLAAGRQ